MSERVSAVIPVWNRRDLLSNLLVSLGRQTYPFAEIIAVDNGSQDGAAELAESQGARVIRLGANAGFAAAVNLGIKECRTEWLAILNTDVELEPEWLRSLLEAAIPGNYWFATGKILMFDRRDYIDGTFDVVCRGGCSWRVGNGRPDGPGFDEPHPIGCAPATAAIFRTELFSRVGDFDKRFESYLEDVDLGIRCAAAGLRGVYVPGAVSYHHGSATLGRWHPEPVRLISRNQVLLVAKHFSTRHLLCFTWNIVVAQGLWALVALRHGAFWPWLRGKAEGLRLFASVRGQSPVDRILRDGERQIRVQSNPDLYWRLYCLLTPGGSE